MTQQPYYPPQQGQYPQQPAPQAPPQQFQPQFPQAPQQPYGQQGGYYPPAQPQQQPSQPLANGGLDEFYGQPSLGGGPGISWKGKPDGYTVQGIVPRDVGDADVQQEVGAPNTRDAGIPQFYRDGRPKFVMAVPLQVPPSQEFPDGEARLYVRGQLREELTRAMAEAGAQGAPLAGSQVTVTLIERKQGRGTIPQNIFRVVYTPPGGQAPQVNQPQQQTPQVPAPQIPTWSQPPAQQQYSQHQPAQVPQQQQFQPQQAAQATGAPSPAPEAPQYQQPQVQQQPAPQGPPAPAGMTADQQALLAQLTGQQNG